MQLLKTTRSGCTDAFGKRLSWQRDRNQPLCCKIFRSFITAFTLCACINITVSLSRRTKRSLPSAEGLKCSQYSGNISSKKRLLSFSWLHYVNYLNCPQSYKDLQLTEKSTENFLLTFLRLKANTPEHGHLTLPKTLSLLTLKIKFLFETCFPQESVTRKS